MTDDYLSYYKHGPHHVFVNVEAMYVEFFLRRFCNIPIKTLVDGYVTAGWPVVKYEELWDQPERELERLLRVWQISVDPERINEAVRKNSLENLRKTYENIGIEALDPTSRSDHFRTGGYGQYASELPDHIIEDIERRFGEYLTSWGYKLSKVRR
jgi:hypothetical protein